MKLRQIPLPEPVYLMRCTVPAQRMSLSIQQRTMAGLSVAASRTAEPDVPAVVLLQAREAPFELEWSLSPAQARADTVLLEISAKSARTGRIRIADNGHGMSEKDVEENWLRIGFSEKRAEKTTTTFLRRKTGEKGIGRLSADRLGSTLELKSKKVNRSATGLLVDWSKFEKPGLEVGQIKLLTLDSPAPATPPRRDGSSSKSGTELLIRVLRQRWTGVASDLLAKARAVALEAETLIVKLKSGASKK